MIKLIIARSSNNIIGKDGGLPWRIKEELQFFKETTMGGAILFGRKTYDSIKRPLPGRTNIIITRNKDLKIDGFEIVNSFDDAVSIAKNVDLFICGGKQIYEQFYQECEELIISTIKEEYEGDTSFPNIDLSNYKLNKEEDRGLFNVQYYLKK